MIDIVIVGSCNVDLISYVTRMPKLGETLIANKFQMGFGGKGANQCIAATNLGATCCMVAKVGADTFGRDYIANFNKFGVTTDYIKVSDEAPTGVAPIAVTDAGENSIIIAPGANMLLTENDILDAETVIANCKVLVVQFEIDLHITLKAIEVAKKHGVTTILNPAPANANIPPAMYENSDYFCPNESEAEILTGKPVDSIEDAKEAAKMLLQRGCKHAIITLGKKGSLYMSRHSQQSIYIPCKQVDVVDSTGAGDAYIGALAYYIACQPDIGIETILTRAGEVATKSVQKPGTQISYPKRSELPNHLFQ